MKIVLTGATGFIGQALTRRLLDLGHEIQVLVRHLPKAVQDGTRKTFVLWDGKNAGDWWQALEGAEAVINLAGENIGARLWTSQQKHRILSSRIEATRALVKAIENIPHKPKVFLSASAVGYYGHVPDGGVTEVDSQGSGFLADVCKLWEEEAMRAQPFGLRVVTTRFGLVLEKNGGMLQKMLTPFHYFFGGPLGSGRQWISWVHRKDLIEALVFLLGREDVSGPVNITAPAPERMKEFCQTIGLILNRPSWFRVPAVILKFMLGEMSEMILTGQRVLPEKLLHAGFHFFYPSLKKALEEIFVK